ncbi:DUF3667 domain-containing protein [Lacihabitans sp. CCS-44]|uniref:DUF3667 domain-containing protein n=1 Tax=Lacihabitans sp. CCS-44 TaxID=2487331 RepID=UPI0020CD7D8C|nr:DUF3667 domain-containing protein [Lacihabitans sp. CCS-44]MCP9754699.1 DUF3667 domain-containing protein [Lacihabitans sp. CCS-44]
MDCKNCSREVSSKFCPDCGQVTSLKRIDGHYIIHEIEHVLHFERGILYTIKELCIRPGLKIREYLTENRSRLVKPIIFIIITSLIYTIIINVFHIEEQYVKFEGEGAKLSTPIKIFTWIQGHYGYANIIMGVFIAFWSKLFFKKYQFNFFEILIMLCFVMGIGMLIFSVFAMLEGVAKLKVSELGGIVGVAYCSWAIGQFFAKEKIFNYIKALFAYLLGMLTFVILAFLLGILIDFIIKH